MCVTMLGPFRMVRRTSIVSRQTAHSRAWQINFQSLDSEPRVLTGNVTEPLSIQIAML